MTKYKHLLSGAALVALGMLGGCGGGGGSVVAMETGEWEMTARVTNVQMENMPPEMREQASRMQNQSSTARNCLTVTADVIRIQNLRFTIPMPMAGPGPVPGCRIPELSMEGGRIRVQMSCEGMPAGNPMMGAGQTMSMSGEMNGTYTAGSVEVTGRGEVRVGDRRGSGEMRITGRRIGACPAPRPYTPPPMPMPVPVQPDMNAMPDATMPADNMADNAM
jgi:hypothetical protein